jgi:hypothetical protein
LKERVERAQAKSGKHAPRERAALFASNQNVRACRALGVGQHAMFFHNELAAQRNHEQYAEPAANQREQKNPRILKFESEKDKCRQREDDAGSDRLSGVPGCLHDVVFKDRGASERAQNADRKHRNRNRGSNSEPRLQADIHRDRAEDDAEERSQQERAESKFRPVLVGRNKRLKFGHP